MSHGIIAVGQVAVGVVAVGQGAVGWVTVGMGGVGLYWTGAMMGVGGSGFGGVLELAPSLGERALLPASTSWKHADHDRWVATRLRPELQLPDGIRIQTRLRYDLGREPPGKVLVHLVKGPRGLEVDRVMRVPPSRLVQPTWWATWVVQFLLLTGLSAAVMFFGLFPLFETLGLIH